MKITSIKMEKVDHYRVLATFSIVFENCFAVHNISLVKKDDGTTFISFYSRKNNEGKFIDICHPINNEFRNEIQSTLINYYEEHKDDTVEG